MKKISPIVLLSALFITGLQAITIPSKVFELNEIEEAHAEADKEEKAVFYFVSMKKLAQS